MDEFYLESSLRFDSNLYIYMCGGEYCAPGHAYGPAIRDHFLIHFVISGKGTFYFEDKVYSIGPNQGFVIFPNDVTFYEADREDPWHYVWIGFNGAKAAGYLQQIGLSNDNPIIHTQHGDYLVECFQEILASPVQSRGRDLKILGLFYQMLAKLIEENPQNDIFDYREEYIRKAINFMEMNYSNKIRVADIAENVNLNPNYFSEFFSKKLKLSPHSFLTELRMNRACEIMRQNATISIEGIALSVGYPDASTFSKAFKKNKGVSPSDYRKALAY